MLILLHACNLIKFMYVPVVHALYIKRVVNPYRSKRKVMNRNWSNQKANPALKTKTGNK